MTAPTNEKRGFKPSERAPLSKKWFSAAITSLNQADYTAKQSILSVQAISTLTISAHFLGNSNTHAIHLAATVRIAQGLGLHRLADGALRDTIEKETGCRVWTQLCTQDWFSTSFYETYLINSLYSRTELPMNCDDNIECLPDEVPTITSYSRFLHCIASIMPQLQDALMTYNTSYTRYGQVLKWGKRLRNSVTAECPSGLLNAPIEFDWPKYLPWARRALAISSSHKIIMIHRPFLSKTFVNPALSFTSRTYLAASKTIIKEYKAVLEEESLILWIYQALSIAAAIILVLDVLHRDTASDEYTDHKALVEDVIKILSGADSMIATRGTKSLSPLPQEIDRIHKILWTQANTSSVHNGWKRQRLDSTIHHSQRTRWRSFNVSTFVKTFYDERNASTKPSSESQSLLRKDKVDFSSNANVSSDEFTQAFLFQPQPGFHTVTDFENLLYLADHDM